MKRSLTIIVATLLLIPSATIAYRVIRLGYPLFPTIPGRVWHLSIRGDVRAGAGGARIALALPSSEASRAVFDEQIGSGTLDFTIAREGPNRIGQWSAPERTALESISYDAQILVRNRRDKLPAPRLEDEPFEIDQDERQLAAGLARHWTALSPAARLRAILDSGTHVLKPPVPGNPQSQAWVKLQEKYGPAKTLTILCLAAGLPARAVEGLSLTEGIQSVPLSWVEVWTEKQWETVRLSTGEIYSNPRALLPLARNGAVIRTPAGVLTDLRWTLSRQHVSNWSLHFERIIKSERWLDLWSLFHLPREFQETFRILLLVPISALLIAVLRNVVGFPSFGIFMPVLMALAFRNTGITLGLSIFAMVIFVGYAFRRTLNQFRLLLVPRLSVLLTLVVACLTVVALIGNKFGLREFMAVGLLPIVILTMTIERFFIITEEAGVREGLRTAAGSAAVAAITFEIIHWELLQLTFFVYPELIFAVAALQVLLGRYTGFRLGELGRFRHLRKPV